MKYIVSRIEDWEVVARAVAERLVPGMVIKLTGPLGAGKTTFVQVLARVLGSTDTPRSPTFSLMRTYAVFSSTGIKRLIHVDAYRLDEPEDVLALGLDEELASNDTVLAIEWAEKIEDAIRNLPSIRMKIEADPQGVRRVTIS